jgi:transposase InsO family protein
VSEPPAESHPPDAEHDAARRDDEAAIHLALFRYAVIAPIVERAETRPGDTTALVREIAGRPHFMPGRGQVRVAERTIYEWLRVYRQHGLEGLRPLLRRDRGASRRIDDATLARAIQLRQEAKARFTSTLLDILKREGGLTGKPEFHRATLDRHLAQRGASRRALKTLGERTTIRMELERFGQLWVGDYHHGPLVLGPDGNPYTAKLCAFIDHATRYPIADRYYLDERLTSLRDVLLRGLLTWGPPERGYVDRGAVFRAEQLAYSLDRVGTKLIFSRAYYSQGRGVIERWWQTAIQFEDEVRLRPELLPLPDLNRYWEAYRELRYCQDVHSAIGKTPAEAIKEVVPKPIDPVVARELFLVREERTVDKRDACVAVLGRRFKCEPWLKRKKVVVRFDPNDMSWVLVYLDGKRVQRALPQQPNERPEPHVDAPQPPPVQSTDYLALVRDDYDRALLDHARPLAYSQLKVDAGFDAERFLTVVADLAGLTPLPAADRQELAAFWDTTGPLPEDLVRIGVEHAVRLHGRGRHVRTYLHAVRTLVLAHWRNPAQKDPS